MFAIILDDQGQSIKHTPEFITRLFDEELNRLLRELPSDSAPKKLIVTAGRANSARP